MSHAAREWHQIKILLFYAYKFRNAHFDASGAECATRRQIHWKENEQKFNNTRCECVYGVRCAARNANGCALARAIARKKHHKTLNEPFFAVVVIVIRRAWLWRIYAVFVGWFSFPFKCFHSQSADQSVPAECSLLNWHRWHTWHGYESVHAHMVPYADPMGLIKWSNWFVFSLTHRRLEPKRKFIGENIRNFPSTARTHLRMHSLKLSYVHRPRLHMCLRLRCNIGRWHRKPNCIASCAHPNREIHKLSNQWPCAAAAAACT